MLSMLLQLMMMVVIISNVILFQMSVCMCGGVFFYFLKVKFYKVLKMMIDVMCRVQDEKLKCFIWFLFIVQKKNWKYYVLLVSVYSRKLVSNGGCVLFGVIWLIYWFVFLLWMIRIEYQVVLVSSLLNIMRYSIGSLVQSGLVLVVVDNVLIGLFVVSLNVKQVDMMLEKIVMRMFLWKLNLLIIVCFCLIDSIVFFFVFVVVMMMMLQSVISSLSRMICFDGVVSSFV